MALHIANLHNGYGGQTVLHDLTTTIPEGKITALIGPNGCCKSTLLKTIARLLPPQSGDITLDGESIYRIAPKNYARRLSLLPQHHMVPEGISVRTLIGYGRSPYLNLWGKLGKADHAVIERVMAATHTGDLADKRVDELSGGQQQRAFLAMTLAQETPYLLLDEPTTYLDVANQLEVLDLLIDLNARRGTTVVMVLHDLGLAARYSDELIAMRSGSILAQGAPSEVVTEETVREVFGISSKVVPDPVSGAPLVMPIGRHRVKGE